MKIYRTIITMVAFVTLFLIFMIDYENKIDRLEYELEYNINANDSLDYIIDSLYHEIDTLVWESEIWDQNILNNTTHLLSAIMYVESSNNDSAYHKGEDAVGCLQIRRCMVDDVNRILTRKKLYKRYVYEDRWSRYRSIEMFDIYCKHYNLNTSEEIARCWNGGPRGINNPATVGYWNKVEKQIKENS